MTIEHKPDLLPQIMAEVIRAVTRLGGNPKSIQESPSIDDVVAMLRQNGADRYLIGTIASWRDTMDDEEVLDDLRRLNEGKPYFDQIIASQDDE
jgi:outer membrane translocation and assembly module TamA